MAEDEIIKKHTKAVYTTWRDPNKKWLHKLKDIFLEVLIIVFAVSVSIWLHNWAETLKDKKEEKEFFKGLKEDLQADVKEMINDRAVFKQVVQYAIYYEKTGRGAVPNKDSLLQYSWIFFTQAQINPRISRFEALKGSGKLDIIEDKKQLYNIIDLYQKIFPWIFRVNQGFNSLNNDKIAPYITDILQLDTNGAYINAPAVLRTSKMRILLTQLRGSAENSITAYTTGIDKSNEILKQAEEELK
jgi:hypothetical protein